MHNEALDVRGSHKVNELGSLLCKNCGELIATVPTNGVKIFYGQCIDNECSHSIKLGGANDNGEASISIP